MAATLLLSAGAAVSMGSMISPPNATQAFAETAGSPHGASSPPTVSRAIGGRRVAFLWYKRGMGRVRISTTVDQQLLADARTARAELNDAALIDEALTALLARHREAKIDAAYAAYDAHPLDEADEWGDLSAFRAAAAST
jgi:hypothetical protein